MNRRAFVAGLGAVLAAPLGAEAQQTTRGDRVVCFALNPRAYGAVSSALDALKQGFRDLGYVEGRNLTLEKRFGEVDARCLPSWRERSWAFSLG
jgi:putative tryptophan/tyrosine transport system substrate-binding protein